MAEEQVTTDEKTQSEEIPSIQIISDIHLEFGGVYEKMESEDRFPKSCAPILALLGDIGYPQNETYWKFIDKIIDRFECIIIITGNHEYYQNEYHEVEHIIKDKITNNPLYVQKLKYLNNECLELPDILPNIRILGTTLWVNYPKADEDDNIAIQYEYRINDFRRIRFKDPSNEEKTDKTPLLTSVNVNQLHRDAVDFLEREMERARKDEQKVIILSHHAPTNYNSIHPETDYKSDALAYGMNYASMEYLFKAPLIGWFFGHTHFNLDMLLRCKDNKDWTVRIASNQQGYIMGYHKDKAPKDYSNEKVIVFPNEDERNKNVKVVKFDEFSKLLVDKSSLVPDASFFQTKVKKAIGDEANNKNATDSKSFCFIL